MAQESKIKVSDKELIFKEVMNKGRMSALANLSHFFPKSFSGESWVLFASQGNADAQFLYGFSNLFGFQTPIDYGEALQGFRLAANQGNSYALYGLAYMYQEGIGIEKNFKEAFQFYLQAAEQGNADALYYVAYSYQEGKVSKQNFKEALVFYEKAAEKGNVKAQMKLAGCHEEGIGVEKDLKEAVRFLKMAVEQGNAVAQVKFAHRLLEGSGVEKDFNEAVWLLKLSAAQGNADAQLKLGDLFEEGEGLERDSKEAFRHYKLAAEQGNAEGQYKLGLCYEYGDGVENDLNAAFQFYELAANQRHLNALEKVDSSYKILADRMGDVSSILEGEVPCYDPFKYLQAVKQSVERGDGAAQYHLATYYEFGLINVPKDAKEAFRLYSLAAEQGNRKARLSLAASYQRGNEDDIVAKDIDEAEKFFRMVAKKDKEILQYYQQRIEQGSMRFLVELAGLYETGTGKLDDIEAKKDITKAFSLYQDAAVRGNAKGQYKLAAWYEEGELVEKDIEEALRLYQLAAKAGHLKARNQANAWADRYSEGENGVQDVKKAFRLYESLMEPANPHALFKLAEFYERGQVVEKNIEEAVRLYERAAAAADDDDDDGDSPWYEGKAGDKLLYWALCYSKGEGVVQNDKEAFRLCKLAYDQQVTKAAFHLAEFYETGRGVEKDIKRALDLYKFAVRKEKDEEAREKISNWALYHPEEQGAQPEAKLVATPKGGTSPASFFFGLPHSSDEPPKPEPTAKDESKSLKPPASM